MVEKICHLPFVVLSLGLSFLCVSGILFMRNQVAFLELRENFHISEACLQCICETGTVCQSLSFTNGDLCKNFRISEAYWIEAGSLTLEGSHNTLNTTEMAYLLCVNNPFCAARTVNGYVGKHIRDCNGDGSIGCYDYAKIHLYGHDECDLQDLPLLTDIRLQRCFEAFSVQ